MSDRARKQLGGEDGTFRRTLLIDDNQRAVRMIRWVALVFFGLQLTLGLGFLPNMGPLNGDLSAGALSALLFALTFTDWFEAYWRATVLLFCVLIIAAINRSSLVDRTEDPKFLSLLLLDMTCSALLPWGPIWQGALAIFCVLSFGLTYLNVTAPPDAIADWMTFLSVLLFSEIIAIVLMWNRRQLSKQYESIVESEKKLKTIFAAGTDIISISSFADERYIDVNDEFERVTGYSRDEVIGKTPHDINFWLKDAESQEENEEPRTKGYVRDATRGFVRNFQAGFLTKRGEQRWGLFSSVLVNLSGQSCVVSFGRDVTEHKKAQEASQHLAAIVEFSEDAIVSATLSNVITSWNGSAARLFGYQASEIIGKPLTILVAADETQQTRERLEKVRRGETIPTYDAVRLKKDGTPLEVSVSLSPIRDPSGSVAGFSAIYKDITENKRAEGELRESETKFKKIFDSCSDTITITSLDEGRYITVNDQFERMMGYTREEVIGRTVTELSVWANPHERIAAVRQLRAAGVLKNSEVEFVGKDGTAFSSLFSAVLMVIAGEQCVVSFVRDIRDRKKAERSRALLAAIVHSADDAILSIDLDHRITTWNPGAERLYGYSVAEIIGQKLETLVPSEELEELEKSFGLVVSGKPVQRFDARRLKKNGTLFDAAVVISPIHDSTGAIVGISGIVRDVTERKQAELELTEAREQALAASRAKSAFLATMSHEIRTPMTAILGMADLLWESSLSPEQRGYVRIARAAGNALNTLIDSILDLSKIEGGHIQLEEIDFDLDEVVQSSVENFTFRAHQKGLELLFSIEPDVPRALRGDPTRLRQVLGNLIGNAVKFTGQGEVIIRVERDPRGRDTGTLRFSVGDTGIGIPHTETESVFDAFTQVDSSITRRYGGSGLGLTICKRLVELMGGRIWLDSQPGKGSIFYFTVNLRVQSQAIVEPAPRLNLKDVKILVADDNASHRRILHSVLGKRGALVSEAADFAEMIQELHRADDSGARYKLLLLDDSLADGNNLDFLERNGKGPVVGAAILMLASTDLNRDVERARQSGARAYLMKPIAPRDLLTTIEATLVNSRPIPRLPHAEDHDAPRDERNLRILLAEDSEDNRVLIQAYLKKSPYQLDMAENGEIAVNKFVNGKYDLVLMDMQMPVMDGYTAVKTIREWERNSRRRRTPIIALTAYALKEDVTKSLDTGCDAHLSKPIKKKVLLEGIMQATRDWRDSYEKHIAHVDSELAPLLPRFLERKRKDIGAIRDHLEQRDYETVRVLGHNIKGEGGGYGLEALTTIGSSIEEAARVKDPDQLREMVDALATYLDEVEVVYDA